MNVKDKIRYNYAFRWCWQWFRPKPAYYHRVTEYGLNKKEKRDVPLIVSLTSYPARIKAVSYTIESILTQECQPDKVILWLAEEQFPNKEKDLPHRLLRLKKYGLEIGWCKDDIRSFKKLVPALKQFSDASIVTADDDVYYPPTWLGKLYSAYKANPQRVCCNRGNRVTFVDGFPLPYNSWGEDNLYGPAYGLDILMTGVGGVLYPPHCLYKDVTTADFMSLARDADDIWFWLMAVLQGTEISVIPDNQNDFDPVFIVGANPTLWGSNQKGHNDVVLKKMWAAYPQLKEIFKK